MRYLCALPVIFLFAIMDIIMVVPYLVTLGILDDLQPSMSYKFAERVFFTNGGK